MRPVILMLAVAGSLVAPAQIPEPVIPQGVGVNIHFVTGHEADLELIAAAGFKVVRMDFVWEATEKARGRYDWSDYETLSANLARRGLRPLYILDYSHHLYEETVEAKNPITGQPDRAVAAPRKPESVAAFASWAAAAARHFQGRGVIWEIWNEPNITFWRPQPCVADYTTLALATAKALRAADPAATIIGPATSGFDRDFLETLLASGVLAYLDGVSVHPYRDYAQPPETAAEDYAKLRAQIARHAPAARQGRLPVLSGEWGYATHSRGVDLNTHAAFAVRQQLANLWCHVPLSIWYDWKDDGPDRNNREHNFGVVFADLKPKPAFHALQTFTRELNGCRVVGRHPAGREEDFILVLRDAGGGTKLAAWTLKPPHEVELTLSAPPPTPLRRVRGDGQPGELRAEQGRLRLGLELLPQYITLGSLRLVP